MPTRENAADWRPDHVRAYNWRALRDRSLSLARRVRAVCPGLLRGSGACVPPPASAVAPCQAAANDRKPRRRWPTSGSGPHAGRQSCRSLPAAGLQAGRAERPEAHKGTFSRCQAVRPPGDSGLAPAVGRDPMERPAAAAACGPRAARLAFQTGDFTSRTALAGPNGPWQELDSDMPGIPRIAAIPVERAATRTVARPRVPGEGAH